MGNDNALGLLNEDGTIISIHVPAWGTTWRKVLSYSVSLISIHVPAWGTTGCGQTVRCSGSISIHVPAWGTTHRCPLLLQADQYFNPRSRVGNDQGRRRNCKADSHNFNPRSRVGNDAFAGAVKIGSDFISIHVPAWGTTPSSMMTGIFTAHFNPRSRVGNDWQHYQYSESAQNFNPRSRVGNDTSSHVFPPPLSCISIHVPAWGTTAMRISIFPFWRFQSTFPRGERPYLERSRTRWMANFNPRSRVGNDTNRGGRRADRQISIHVPAWGTTLCSSSHSSKAWKFQSTFPRGERPE